MDNKTVLSLLDKKTALGVSRRKKYISNTGTLSRMAGGNLDAMLKNMEKVNALAAKIDASDYQAWTKSDLKLMLKMLWKEANGHDQLDMPKEIRWLRVGVKRKDKKHPKRIDEKEIEAMLKVVSGRDKAIIHLLYEAGLRPHELLRLKKNDIDFTRDGARVNVPAGTKTGARSILVIDCVPSLAAWIAVHPLKKRDAVLFPSEYGMRNFQPMSVENLNKLVKGIARRAGASRPLKTYDFRHNAASRLAVVLTDAQMKAYFGWTQDSEMAATYINLSGRDVDAPLLAAHGKKVDKLELEGKLTPQMCTRCGKQNAHDAAMCQYCGLSFDKDKAKADNLSIQAQLADALKRLEVVEHDARRRGRVEEAVEGRKR